MASEQNKPEEQIAKEREAVESMRNAKSNMALALDRISTLEFALKSAASALARCKTYIGPSCYVYPDGRGSVTCHADIDKAIADAQAKLGGAA